MANTLKFGDGKWGAKKDSILAYNDENANFKPLPFTTSRASTATRINKAGLIEKVENGIPRVDYLGNTKGAMLLEPQSTNLIKYSEAFGNSYWTKSGAIIQGDPSTAGSELADQPDFNAVGNWTFGGSGVSISGGVCSFIGSSYSQLRNFGILTIGKTYKVTYEVSSWSVGTIETVGCGITRTGNGVYTDYLTATTVNFVMGTGASSTLNLEYVNIQEVQGFASPSADSPLGAFKLVEGTNNGSHFLYSANAGGSVGNLITTSFFAKASERSWCKILGYDGSAVWFDLTNGVIGTETSAKGSIESLSDGWYKISSTYTSSDASKEKGYLYMGTADGVDGYTGDGTSGVYIFGAQVEQQSYATSYIPNYGESAGVTRLVDTAIGAGNASTFNSTEGVLFWEGSFDSTSTTPGAIALIGAGSNRVQLYNSGTSIVALIQVNGIVVFNQTTNGTIPIISNHKYAIKYALNDFALWIDGIEIGISASGSTFGNSALTELRFSDFGTGYLFANTKQLQYFNTALTDSELQALTTI